MRQGHAGGRALAALLTIAAVGCSRGSGSDKGAPSNAGAPANTSTPSDAGAPSDSGAPAVPSPSPSSSPTPTSASAAPAEAAPDPDPIPLEERRRIAGSIAFISERDGNQEVYLIRPSGEDLRRLTDSPAADFPAAADPQGAALLIISAEEDHAHKLHLEQLVIQPLAGGPGKPIGPRGGRNRNASFSPDGKSVVFESDVESFSDIYRIGRDGAGLKRLTRNTEGNFEPAVSPDGAHIAFVSSRDGDPELYRMRADGSKQERLTAFHREDSSPRWSPDGKRIAFVSDRERRSRIFVMNAKGAQLSALTASAAESNAPEPAPAPQPQGAEIVDELDPAWSPDGTRIAYVTRAMGKRARVWVADVAARQSKALTSDAHGNEAAAWSPDGRYIAFVSSRAGDPEVYLMRADGTGQTRLTHAKGADWLPRWIPAARTKRK